MATQGSTGITKDEVDSFLKRFTDLYEKSDEGFFDLFAHDATVFNLYSNHRLDGRDAFRKSFGPHFKSHGKRTSEILSRETQIVGDTALVSYNNRIQVDDKRVDLRGSLLLNKENGGLQVKHLHNSSLTGVASAAAGKPVEDIQVLEERVATSLSAIGTPK
ncbi:MAG TPA: nuclear transport factor 2 family protein [Thermoanaerobaculia bacterium]|jgi:ketosteroid isomerase-like protein